MRVDFFEHGGHAGCKLWYKGRDTRNKWKLVDHNAVWPIKKAVKPPPRRATSKKGGGWTETYYSFRQGSRVPTPFTFRKHRPKDTRVVNSINYATTSRTWRGYRHGDHFAVRWLSRFTVRQSGKYDFKLASDDGSILYVNGKRVVNNDGLHGMRNRQGSYHFSKGRSYEMRVDFFEHGGHAGCKLWYKGPDTHNRWKIVDRNVVHTFKTSGRRVRKSQKSRKKVIRRPPRPRITSKNKVGGWTERYYGFRQGSRVPPSSKFRKHRPVKTRVVNSINYANTGRTWRGYRHGNHFAVRWSSTLKVR